MHRLRVLIWLVVLAMSVIAWGGAGPASANWLTKVLGEAGDVGGKGLAKGPALLERELGHAFGHVKSLPDSPDVLAVAAHAGPEGHWRFATRGGETFTAGSADEMARLREVLAPGDNRKLSLYLTPDTVFAQRALVKDLPADAELFVVSRQGAHKLVTEGDTFFADVRPGLRAKLDAPVLLEETLFQLAQPLKPSTIRILALETGSEDALRVVPRFDPTTRAALVDRIDPQRLAGALRSVKGQTVILTGRVEGESLKFLDSAGGEGTLSLSALRAAARDFDVHLVLVKSAAPRQPGGRNWLWQTAEIPSLDRALKQATFGDFLATLGPKGGGLTVTSKMDGYGRAVLEALPTQPPSGALQETWSGWVDSLAGDVMGQIAVSGIEAMVPDRERQEELQRRMVPGIDSGLQIFYVLTLGLSLFGLGTAWRWWERLWPMEERAEYGSWFGYSAARSIRQIVFATVFLPLVGIPLFLRYVALQAWAIVTAPFRALRWVWGKMRPQAG